MVIGNHPAILHRSQSIVQQVEEDLLQLTPVRGDSRQILSQLQIDLDVAVERFFFEERQRFPDHFVQIQNLNLDLHAARKTQQTVGDRSATINRLENGIGQGKELFLLRKTRHRIQ